MRQLIETVENQRHKALVHRLDNGRYTVTLDGSLCMQLHTDSDNAVRRACLLVLSQ